MATTKLGLPTITGNMTADVVRDVNALAEAVDGKAGAAGGLATLGSDGKVPAGQLSVDTSNLATKTEVSTLNQTVTTHLAEDAMDAHNATNISFAPPAGMTAIDVQAAIAEVFQSGNNVKSDMVAALLAVDPTLPITNNSTWAEIELAAGQIKTGKKYAEGSATVSSTGKLTISNLSFAPKYLLFWNFSTSLSIIGAMRSPASAMVNGLTYWGGFHSMDSGASQSYGYFVNPYNTSKMESNGFIIDFSSLASRNINWIVFGE